jgi:hypothetical protein
MEHKDTRTWRRSERLVESSGEIVALDLALLNYFAR